MKRQILFALKAKFIGVSESILSRIADKLAKTVLKEDDVAAAIEGVTFNQVLENYGDSRATEAQQTAVSNYEKKYGLKDGQKVQGGEPVAAEPTITLNNNGGIPIWAKSIIDDNKSLRDEIRVLKGGNAATVRKQQLFKIIGKLPESFRRPYTRLDVQSMTDEEFAALAAELQTEVDGIDAEIKPKWAVFGRPVGCGIGVNSDAKPDDKDVEILAQELASSLNAYKSDYRLKIMQAICTEAEPEINQHFVVVKQNKLF